MAKVILSAKDTSFELQHKTLFKELNLTIKEGDRIGLVGKNGSGKSTLLKLLAGQIETTRGVIENKGSSYYLPQLDFSLFGSTDKIEEYVFRQGVNWSALNAKLRKWFKENEIKPDQKLQTLSGGELMKLNLAIAEAHNPNLLLLDEPTNHLDAEGIDILKKFLTTFPGAFIIVSHDPFFLNLVVNHIWELEEGAVAEYGGNYTHYADQKQFKKDARERDYTATKKKLKKVKKSIEAEQKRADRSKRVGRKEVFANNMPPVLKGFYANQASGTAGKQGKKLRKIMAQRDEKASTLKKEKQRPLRFVIDHDTSGARKTLIAINDGVLGVAEKTLIENIDLRIVYGDRLVLVGKNGSGKSTLAKSIAGEDAVVELGGYVKRSPDAGVVYVDQKYQIIAPNLTLIENVEKYNPKLTHEEVRRQLGRFLFYKEEDARKKAGVLSGGEAARLVFAMVTAGSVDLLVLDEPTNNLDIETLDIIADALKDFAGALVIISHNIHFLKRIGIDTALIIDKKKLKTMRSSPAEPEAFYNEMVSSMSS
ncbi:MAG: ABC-F family ATP-binding cassette domain-containing protein [bacterium]|nr:ABC-F family ATP-binding cassette domain-containing protein [bacterium]